MWVEGVTKWYQSMVQLSDLMGGVLVMLLLITYVFLILVLYVFVHPCCVRHSGDGVAMGWLMMLLSTCGHVCMIDYVLFMFVYCAFSLAYILLHVVYALLVYARSHIGHVCVVFVYACFYDFIC